MKTDEPVDPFLLAKKIVRHREAAQQAAGSGLPVVARKHLDKAAAHEATVSSFADSIMQEPESIQAPASVPYRNSMVFKLARNNFFRGKISTLLAKVRGK